MKKNETAHCNLLIRVDAVFCATLFFFPLVFCWWNQKICRRHSSGLIQIGLWSLRCNLFHGRGELLFLTKTKNKKPLDNLLIHHMVTEIRASYSCDFFSLLLAMDKWICSLCCDAKAPVWETGEDNSRCREQTRLPQWWVSMVLSVSSAVKLQCCMHR